MSEQVILYDLPSQQGTAWSLNPFKTRMILNFKGVDYKTEWVEYPDLESTFKSFGIPANNPEAPGYFADFSSPAIKYANGKYGMDSWPIAHELEKQYPSPSLHLDDPIVIKIRDHISKMLEPLVPHIIPRVPLILNKASQDYFYKTREKAFGMPLEQVEKQGATEKGWEDAKAPVKEAGDLLRKNGGPYFLGQTVSYADFIFVSMLHFIRRVDQDHFEKFLGMDEAFPKILEASKQWLEKDT